jgi:hypothetical protein
LQNAGTPCTSISSSSVVTGTVTRPVHSNCSNCRLLLTARTQPSDREEIGWAWLTSISACPVSRPSAAGTSVTRASSR